MVMEFKKGQRFVNMNKVICEILEVKGDRVVFQIRDDIKEVGQDSLANMLSMNFYYEI